MFNNSNAVIDLFFSAFLTNIWIITVNAIEYSDHQSNISFNLNERYDITVSLTDVYRLADRKKIFFFFNFPSIMREIFLYRIDFKMAYWHRAPEDVWFACDNGVKIEILRIGLCVLIWNCIINCIWNVK